MWLLCFIGLRRRGVAAMEERMIVSGGDEVRVFNDQGEIRIEARVTNRVMPGVAAIRD